MELVPRCSCCGKAGNDLVLGYKTIFDEYDLICEECLNGLYMSECYNDDDEAML